MLPKYTNYYWNRWSRGKRMLWRNAIFWPTIALLIGIAIDMTSTLLAVGYVLMFLVGRLYQSRKKPVTVIQQTTGRAVKIHAEMVTVPETADMDNDENELDAIVQAELLNNVESLQAIQAMQTPQRKKKNG